MKKMVIGLTGPIAAGKNTVAKGLKGLGAHVVEVDELAHTLYKPQTLIWGEIVRAFGSKVLKRGGEINRKKLGEVVFSDRKKLQALNRIMHPALKQAVAKEIESGKQAVVVNAAVLKEIGLIDLVDAVWVVIASKENRLKRLVKSGLTKMQAMRRIAVQPAQKEYLKIADLVIRNDGTLRQLNEKIRAGIKL